MDRSTPLLDPLEKHEPVGPARQPMAIKCVTSRCFALPLCNNTPVWVPACICNGLTEGETARSPRPTGGPGVRNAEHGMRNAGRRLMTQHRTMVTVGRCDPNFILLGGSSTFLYLGKRYCKEIWLGSTNLSFASISLMNSPSINPSM